MTTEGVGAGAYCHAGPELLRRPSWAKVAGLQSLLSMGFARGVVCGCEVENEEKI